MQGEKHRCREEGRCIHLLTLLKIDVFLAQLLDEEKGEEEEEEIHMHASVCVCVSACAYWESTKTE